MMYNAVDDRFTAVDFGTTSSRSVDQGGPVRFYHLAIVGVFGFGLGATVVWLLFLRLGPAFGSAGGSPAPGLKSPHAADGTTGEAVVGVAAAAAGPRALRVANGTAAGRFSTALAKYHLPLPVYPRSSGTATTSTTDRPAPPIDVRQYFHEPNS